jgi:hypothetical protein
MDAHNDSTTWYDKVAIQELIVKYCDAATRGDWDTFESLFTSDAVCEVVPPTGTDHVYASGRSRSVGPRQIRESSEAAVEPHDFFIQVTHGSVVTLLGSDRASATTTIHALARQQGDHDYMHYGIYYDELVKRDGEWKFSSRLLQPIYFEFAPLSGQVAISRGDLTRR